MAIGEICNREVVIVQRDTTVQEAAQLMRTHHVGALVVVREVSGRRHPVGVITDRDLVVEVMAPELDASVITAGDIMLPKPATVLETTGVFETIQLMRDKAVRRVPVVDEHGALIGIVALDDLLSLLTEELSELSSLVSREQKREMESRH